MMPSNSIHTTKKLCDFTFPNSCMVFHPVSLHWYFLIPRRVPALKIIIKICIFLFSWNVKNCHMSVNDKCFVIQCKIVPLYGKFSDASNSWEVGTCPRETANQNFLCANFFLWAGCHWNWKFKVFLLPFFHAMVMWQVKEMITLSEFLVCVTNIWVGQGCSWPKEWLDWNSSWAIFCSLIQFLPAC